MSSQIIELCRKSPPLESHDDGSPYILTPDQHKQVSKLIKKRCCNCRNGNCLVLDDGEEQPCPQIISYEVCCRWFRNAVLPIDRELEAEIYREKVMKRCALCGALFIPKSNRGKYCTECSIRRRRQKKAECERKRRCSVDI